MNLSSLCENAEKSFSESNPELISQLKQIKEELDNSEWLNEAKQFRNEYLGHNLRKRSDKDGPEYKYIAEIILLVRSILIVVAKLIHMQAKTLPEEFETTNQIDKSARKFWAAVENGLLTVELVEDAITNS